LLYFPYCLWAAVNIENNGNKGNRLNGLLSGQNEAMINPSRRQFLKASAAGTAYWVVSCNTPSQPKSTPVFPDDIYQQNSLVDQAEVDKTLDALAQALAQKGTGPEAWQTIFQKPVGKEWSQVKAAIKFNEVGKNKNRIALLAKVANELIDLGVPAPSIRVYGGRNVSGADMISYFDLIKSMLPVGIKVSQYDSELGGVAPATIPSAAKDLYEITSTECIKEIADHTNDILVNITVNKGHWEEYGGFTLCMKNHFGTYDPQPFRIYSSTFEIAHGNFNYLLAINQADCLVGGPVPQQQLCIVDSLWATTGSNMGEKGDDTPYNRLVMGTFAPTVDILTVKEIRQGVQGAVHSANADKILPAFGYTDSEINDMKLVTVDADNPSFIPTTYPATSVNSINPAIDNRRVVSCHNDKMVKT
jgi:hypothetical protein